MRVLAQSADGTIKAVGLGSDNALLIGSFVILFFSGIPISLVQGPLTIGIVLVAAAIFAGISIRRLGAKKIPATSKAVKLIQEECQRMGISPIPVRRIYWIPGDFNLGARLVGAIRAKLVVTSGFLIASERGSQEAIAIARHEIAHIRNRDWLAYFLYGSYWLMVAIAVVILIFDQKTGTQAIIAQALSGLWMIAIVRRREYLADIVAVANSSQHEAVVYKNLPQRCNAASTSAFHPSAKRRFQALELGSPVLRTGGLVCFSAMMLLVTGVVVSYQNAAELVTGGGSIYSIQRKIWSSGGFRFGCFVTGICCLVILALEFGKARTKKRICTTDFLRARVIKSQLHIAFGFSDNIDWVIGIFSAFGLYLSSTASVMIWYATSAPGVLHVSPLDYHAIFLSASSFGLALFSIVLLVSLRLSQNPFVAGLYAALASSLPFAKNVIESPQLFTDVARNCAGVLLGALFFGLFTRRFRNVTAIRFLGSFGFFFGGFLVAWCLTIVQLIIGTSDALRDVLEAMIILLIQASLFTLLPSVVSLFRLAEKRFRKGSFGYELGQ